MLRWQTRTALRMSFPTEIAALSSLSYVGDYAYEQLTGKSAYDQTDWSAYEALLMKLEQEIVYKAASSFPERARI